MPVGWEIRGVILRLSFVGVVEKEEIERAIAEALSDPRAHRGMRLLWDARRSATPVSADDIAWRLELVSRFADQGLFTRAALLFGDTHRATAAIFEPEMSRSPLRLPGATFTDEAEALAWLEGPAADPGPR